MNQPAKPSILSHSPNAPPRAPRLETILLSTSRLECHGVLALWASISVLSQSVVPLRLRYRRTLHWRRYNDPLEDNGHPAHVVLSALTLPERAKVRQGIRRAKRRSQDVYKEPAPKLRRIKEPKKDRTKDGACTSDPLYLTGSIEKYAGSHPITEGAYSDVFHGKWTQSDGTTEVVAMKRFRVRNYDEALICDEISRESQVWQTLQHFNILPLRGLCKDASISSHPIIISPWCANGNTTEYTQKLGAGATPIVILELLCGAANGFAHMHSSEPPVVHGDIKSNNILVGQEGQALICDFGKSRILAVASPSLVSASITGAVHWMAPELIDTVDKPRPTPSTDVYAFGCLIYHLCSGEVPFGKLSPFQIIGLIARGDAMLLSRPTLLRDRLWDELWKIIGACRSREPEKRPSMQEVARRLHIIASDLKARAIECP